MAANTNMDFYNRMSTAGGIGSGLSGLFGLFNSSQSKRPMNAAMGYLNQIPQEAGSYYQPYQEAGQDALSQLRQQYGQMTSNPSELYNQLSSGYTQSPGYQFRLKEALGAASNAAQAGGMAGTPFHQRQAQEVAEGLASKDFEEYLNHMLGIYGAGQQGMSNIEQQGFDSSKALSDLLAGTRSAQAQYAYTGETQRNADQSRNWSNLAGGLGMLLAGLL